MQMHQSASAQGLRKQKQAAVADCCVQVKGRKLDNEAHLD